jgi:1,4-dihydroxy-2-naphthoate octaprenyltransferase
VVAAALLVGPFAAAAHLANALRDFDADAALGSRNLTQVLGWRAGQVLAVALAMGVGVTAGLVLQFSSSLPIGSLALGVVGLIGLVQGMRSPQRLWHGMLVVAVCWTVAWALATG